MDDEDLVLAGELDDPLEEAVGDDRAGRVVRVVEEHQPGAVEVVGRRSRRGRGRSRARARAAAAPPRRRRAAGRRCRPGSRGRRRARRRRGRGRRSRGCRCTPWRRSPGSPRSRGRSRRRSGARRSARTPRGTPRGRGSTGTGGARVGDRRLHRLDDVRIGRRVGIADPEADHVDPRRLLVGDLALELGEHVGRNRLEALGWVGERHGPARLARSRLERIRERSASSPRARSGCAVPVRVTSRSPRDLDGQLAAVELDRDRARRAAQERGDRGAARAGPGGERLPHPALEDPRPHASSRRPSRRRRWSGSGRARCSTRSPGRSRPGRAPRASSPTSITHCGLPTLTCWKLHSRPPRSSVPRPSSGPPGSRPRSVDARPIAIETVSGPGDRRRHLARLGEDRERRPRRSSRRARR